MGLGSAEEVAHETVLCADHVVFENSISSIAEDITPQIGEGTQKAFEDNREAALEQLYPHINQYLAIEPLWRRDMASFVYPASCSVQSAPDELVRLFVEGAHLRVTRKGEPWFQVTCGPSRYTITPSYSVKGFQVFARRLWKSTRERAGLMPAMWYGDSDGTTDDDEEKLTDPAHPLHAQFQELVREELQRIEGILGCCFDSGAYFLTDEGFEWKVVLQMVSGERSPDGPVASAYDLTSSLAFLRDIPLDRLLDMRESFSAPFERTRGAILKLSEDLSPIRDLDERKAAADRMIVDEVQPALSDLSLQIRASANDVARTGAVVVGVASVSVLAAWLFGSVQPLLGAVGTTPFLSRLLDKYRDRDNSRRDPLYFLWKVREEA
jgi:hypothetical protein